MPSTKWVIILFQTIASSSPFTFCLMNMYPREKNKWRRKARLGSDSREKHQRLGKIQKVHEQSTKQVESSDFKKNFWIFILKVNIHYKMHIKSCLRCDYFNFRHFKNPLFCLSALYYFTFPSTLLNALYLAYIWGWWIFIAEAEK